MTEATAVEPSRARAHAAPVATPEIDWETIRRVARVVQAIARVYFRAEVRGLARVPVEPSLLVSNHDGGNLPVDGLCFAAAWHHHFQYRRPLRVLMHEIPFQLFGGLTRLLHRVGCISAAPAGFEAVVDRGECVLVYPGAAREAFRTYARRREIDLGGRTGFVKRALRRRLPITPVVSAGAHETMFILRRGQRLARWLRVDRHFRADVWPLIAGVPLGLWLGPFFPHLPLPAKITIEVLEPIYLEREVARLLGRPIGPDSADDPEAVRTSFDLIQTVMQAGLHRLYAERRLPILG